MTDLSLDFPERRAVGRGGPSRNLLPMLLMAAAFFSGCSSGSSPAVSVSPPPTTTPPPPAALKTDTAISLFEAAWMQASLTASALEHAAVSYRVRTTEACVFGSGSMLAALDGGPVTAGPLPVGNHTFEVTFRDCLVDGLVGISLNGTASVVYTSADLSDLTAMVSTSSMRGTGLAFSSGLSDVTAKGSGTWRRVSTSEGFMTTTYEPATGSTLINNLTGHSLTFLAGTYSSGQTPPPLGSSASVQQDFANMKVAIDGTEYVLDGSLQSVYGFVGNQGRHTGEIRITSNGALVARILGDTDGGFRIDVLNDLVPF
jgi:hypothetical protein